MKRRMTTLPAGILVLLVISAQAQWSPAKRLTWTSGWSEWPVLAADSQSHLHVAWTDNTTGHYEVYYKKSTNGGTTWTATRRLTWASSFYSAAAIAVDTADNIHLVWCNLPPGDGEIYYKKSTDGGTKWTASKRLTWTSGSCEDPVLTVDSMGNIHIAWEDSTPGDYEIYYKKSTDGGVDLDGKPKAYLDFGYFHVSGNRCPLVGRALCRLGRKLPGRK